MGFTYVKTIYLTRALGEEHVLDEREGGHGKMGMGIALEIMVREPNATRAYVMDVTSQ